MMRIGLSACFFHADPKRPIFKGKTLLYVEQSMLEWFSEREVVTYMVPSFSGKLTPQVLAADLDGLVLNGGSDVAPESYGETPIKPEWKGDRVRDLYEIELMKAFVEAEKPILGICRGIQLMNVACGGTLYQDVETQIQGSFRHRDWEIYDQNSHEIMIEGDHLRKLYPGLTQARVNSVHHQAVKDLGEGVRVEARSVTDGVIEAISVEAESYLFGVQWHPEFQVGAGQLEGLIEREPILDDFLSAVRMARGV